MAVTRVLLRSALYHHRFDLALKSTLIKGKALVRVFQDVLKTRNGGFPTFLRMLPSKYSRVPLYKLRAVWNTTIAFLKARAVLGQAPRLLQFKTASDERVRHNHSVLDGFIMSPYHPMCNVLSTLNVVPPLDYNCRCKLVPVSFSKTHHLLSVKGMKYYRTRKLPRDARGFGFKGL